MKGAPPFPFPAPRNVKRAGGNGSPTGVPTPMQVSIVLAPELVMPCVQVAQVAGCQPSEVVNVALAIGLDMLRVLASRPDASVLAQAVRDIASRRQAAAPVTPVDPAPPEEPGESPEEFRERMRALAAGAATVPDKTESEKEPQ